MGRRLAWRAGWIAPLLVAGTMAVLAPAGALVPLSPLPANAQSLAAQTPADSMAFYKALELESAGKYRDAAPLFRTALHSSTGSSALLGLERVYAELGCSDSLLAPLDTLIASNPRDETYRTVQLRTLQAVGRDAELRKAFDDWVQAVPGSAVPYREYARLLLQKSQSAAADSVLARANQVLGTTKDLDLELAQARAAEGKWVESAHAWRAALVTADYLEQAAAYALAPTPSASRQEIRDIFLAPPVAVAARRALADLESTWGSPSDGWNALKDLPPDSLAAEAWSDFAARNEAEDRWTYARDALEAALHWKRTPDLALRAANAAMNAGDPTAALRLAPISDANGDSASAAANYLPLRARALAALGRPAEVERLVRAYDRFLSPGTKNSLTRTIARGWVRAGDMNRARAALAASGPEGDSSDAAGWLALYDGNMKTARALLRSGTESSPELALALGLVARVKIDTAPGIGKAFLALARNDSAQAAALFVAAGSEAPAARSLLLLVAAQIQEALHNETAATALWNRILANDADSPEAPEAELEWAKQLHRRGDLAAAKSHLEHLILTYSESALLPQARRELELVQSAIPPVVDVHF